MIITSGTPTQIIRWFQTGDHEQELLCIVLATSRDDRKRLARLIQEFFELDVVLGRRIAFLVPHQEAKHKVGLRYGAGQYAALEGEVYALRDTRIFRDLSDETEMYRAQIARESARTMARLVPEFIELFDIAPADLPALCTLVRKRNDVIVASLGPNWGDAELSAYVRALRAIVDRPHEAIRELPGTLAARIAALENDLRELSAKTSQVGYALERIARRHKASEEDRRRIIEFLASPCLESDAFDRLLNGLSFASDKRFIADQQVARVRGIVSRIQDIRQWLRADALSETNQGSIVGAAEELARFRNETVRLISQIPHGRVVSTNGQRNSIIPRVMRLAEYINTTGDLGEKIAWLIAKLRELIP